MKVKLKDIKREYTKTGSRQVINSPHKTFNNLTNLLDNTGNLISNTQVASYIRAYNQTDNCGFNFDKGELQNADLKHLTSDIVNIVKNCEDKDTRFWYSHFYIDKKFCTFLLNLKTMELYVFDYSTNKKQYELIEWLVHYMFEWVE